MTERIHHVPKNPSDGRTDVLRGPRRPKNLELSVFLGLAETNITKWNKLVTWTIVTCTIHVTFQGP